MTVLQATPLDDPGAVIATEGAAMWWLGQAGFLVAQGGLRIVIDPYLSDSLAEKYRGTAFPHERMMPSPVAPGALRGIDWVLATHAHSDHMDPGTLPALFAANPHTRGLVPRAERARAIERGMPADRLVTIDAGESRDLGGVTVTATAAAHETLRQTAEGWHHFLGYALSGAGVTLWHSGDCVPYPGLTDIVRALHPDVVLLPINGRDSRRAAGGIPGNMTLDEALSLADACGARAMIGHHFGLFDFNTADPVAAADRIATLRPRAEVVLAQTGTVWTAGPEKEVTSDSLLK